MFNSVNDIKKAINTGKIVYWKNQAYQAIKDSKGQYLVHCNLNGYCWGLTDVSGERLNGEFTDFFTE